MLMCFCNRRIWGGVKAASAGWTTKTPAQTPRTLPISTVWISTCYSHTVRLPIAAPVVVAAQFKPDTCSAQFGLKCGLIVLSQPLRQSHSRMQQAIAFYFLSEGDVSHPFYPSVLNNISKPVLKHKKLNCQWYLSCCYVPVLNWRLQCGVLSNKMIKSN